MSPPIPPSFQVLKTRILSSLSVDPSTYTDASPKGSVDAGIRDFMDRINGLEGVVTKSSCAGRVSVFLEGSKHIERERNRLGREGVLGDGDGDGDRSRDMQVAVPGGKGRGGRWLYVSHDPVSIPPDRGKDYFTRLFGLYSAGDQGDTPTTTSPSARRFVRFQFEPFVGSLACWHFAYSAIPSSSEPKANTKGSNTNVLTVDPPHRHLLPPPRQTHPLCRHQRRLPGKRRAIPQEPRRPRCLPHGGCPNGGFGAGIIGWCLQ